MESIQTKRIAQSLILVCCLICLPISGLAASGDSGQIEQKLLPSGPGPKRRTSKFGPKKLKKNGQKPAYPRSYV